MHRMLCLTKGIAQFSKLLLIGVCARENDWFRWFTSLPVFMVLVFMFMGERLGTRKSVLSLDVTSIVQGSNIKYAWKLELL